MLVICIIYLNKIKNSKNLKFEKLTLYIQISFYSLKLVKDIIMFFTKISGNYFLWNSTSILYKVLSQIYIIFLNKDLTVFLGDYNKNKNYLKYFWNVLFIIETFIIIILIVAENIYKTMFSISIECVDNIHFFFRICEFIIVLTYLILAGIVKKRINLLVNNHITNQLISSDKDFYINFDLSKTVKNINYIYLLNIFF